MKQANIHGCEFIDAGGRWEKGEPGVKGGITGGGLFAIWMANSEIHDNRFTRTQQARERVLRPRNRVTGVTEPAHNSSARLFMGRAS